MSNPIQTLIERFSHQRESYQQSDYNEAQTRIDFVNPFFIALGWDVDNKQGLAEPYRQVVYEDVLKINRAPYKRPDYSFRVGGVRKFFVEAKKPAIHLKTDPSPAYQVRRYGWNAKLSLSIVTNFAEFAVYDCRLKPSITDDASRGRVLYLQYTDYIEHWEELVERFSYSAVWQGQFDEYANSATMTKGTVEVDTAFLTEMESWREQLASHIVEQNPALTQRQLNFVVQQTIDRIIFLRIGEDRGIEDYGRLLALTNGQNIYQRLFELFRTADERYNSGLFHFKAETGREAPDNLTPRLNIGDAVLQEIINQLYYPVSPYEFSVLPADILGQVYERFLGKVIRLTSKQEAIIEDKPAVKKAGGVFYTPSYIVDYIVKQTVGKLLESQKVKANGLVKKLLGNGKDSASRLKILDPACGSGSFLLGAYQFLLDWHLEQYLLEPEKWLTGKKPRLYHASGGTWKLTVSERKRILLNNIYGVDIDSQAVEVTKLSLLLKVLEDEQSVISQLSLFKERVLPDINQNIKCGNSLISHDFYQGQSVGLIDSETQYRINAFDWESEFSEAMQAGGFDAVIGNPPWGSFFTESEKSYLSQVYVNRSGEAESQLFFLEKSFRLLNQSGTLGFITPNTWLSVLRAEKIRQYLLENAKFYEICELSKYIFKQAPDIVPILVFLGRLENNQKECIIKRTNVLKVHADNFNEVFSSYTLSQKVWKMSTGAFINIRATPVILQITTKCKDDAVFLSELCEVLYGIKTGNNKKYLSKALTETHQAKALKTGELTRYHLDWKNLHLWWCQELAGYRSYSVEVPKIIVQYIRKLSLSRRIIAAIDLEGMYYPLNNYSYLTLNNKNYSLKYILGILNSKLINFYFANTFIDYNIKPTYLQQLPIHAVDFDNATDKANHDLLVQLVNQMLTLNQQRAADNEPHTQKILERRIEATDKQIDQLVYTLYDLTAPEIEMVENNG